MPIYEFYCPDCHTLFNFYARRVNTTKRPDCPRCGRKRLERQISLFATGTGGKESEGPDDLPVDENRMMQAAEALAGEAEKLNEDNPRQAAELMRKFSKMTGMHLGEGMEEALGRMEAGEDPEQIEAELGDVLEAEEPFFDAGAAGPAGPGTVKRRGEPARDPTLYDL